MGIGEPEDLTGAVVLLCSDAGRFMTGIDIKIDGRCCETRTGTLEADSKIIRWVYDILAVAVHVNLNVVSLFIHLLEGSHCFDHTSGIKFTRSQVRTYPCLDL